MSCQNRLILNTFLHTLWGLAKWKNKVTIGVGKVEELDMRNTAELDQDDRLSHSQLLKIQKSNLPTAGTPLTRISQPNAPSMTGESDKLILVPEEDRGDQGSMALELAVRIISDTLF